MVVAAVVLVCLAAACTTVPLPPDSSAVLIEGIPFHPQEEYQCGPASLAGVMNHWGTPVTPGDIAREIFSRSAGGSLTADMARYAERKGLAALQYRGSWADLRTKVAGGYPLVVLVDSGFSLYQVNHFMVVVGFDSRGVIVNSGLRERTIMDRERFLREWERTGFWTLWVRPREG